MSSTIHGSSVHVMVLCFVLCTYHGFVFCDVYKELSMSKLCALCFGQGMVLHDQIGNPWISLTSFLHIIRASRKII
jgi:hypothetical protein